jgi:hypothetical protein
MTDSRKSFGDLKTYEPTYDTGTKVFSISMEFRSHVAKIDREAIEYVTGHAADLFKRILSANNLQEVAWPPDTLNVIPHGDFRGARFDFSTRASPRSVIVIEATAKEKLQ